MRAAIAWTLAAALAPAAAAQLTIVPSTGLTAETSNNTSAADSFTTQTNGNLGAGNISKMPIRSLLYAGSTTRIYAHFMPWFGGSNHMNVGYRSDDPAQVKRQVDDMISRGISGAIIDWYGPNYARENNTTIYMMREAETRTGFEFAVMEDVGALKKCAGTAGCDVTQRLIDDLNYAAATFYSSPAYMRRDGRPVVFFFGVDAYPIDWARARAGVIGNPLFIFRNNGAYTHAQTNGGFSWVGISSTDPNNPGTGYLGSFYSTAKKYPALKTFGSAYPGFNDSLAAWAPTPPRIVNRNCGATWLATMAEAGRWYSTSNQLQEFQLVTWNDYEEGTEIESGIDNCVRIAASVSGKQLSWSVTGDPATIDHFVIFISLDGENLMVLTYADAAVRVLDLGAFDLAVGNYTLHVKAYAKASMKNQISGPVSYAVLAPPPNQPPVAQLAVSPGSGVAPVSVTASGAASTDADGRIVSASLDFGDGTVVDSLTASHAYSSPGSYTVRLTLVDDDGASSSTSVSVNVTAPKLVLLTPANEAVVDTNFRVVAEASMPSPMATMRVLLDGRQVYAVNGVARMDAYVQSSSGKHRLTVEAVDTAGRLLTTSVLVQVRKSASRESTTSTVITVPAPSSSLRRARRAPPPRLR